MQTVRTTLNRASAEATAREKQPPAIVRKLREEARHDLTSEAVNLAAYVRAQERLARIEAEVNEAKAYIREQEQRRAEAWEAMTEADAKLKALNRATNLNGAAYDHERVKELQRAGADATRARENAGDSIGRKRRRIKALSSEAEVLSAIVKPETPTLVALRDALS